MTVWADAATTLLLLTAGSLFFSFVLKLKMKRAAFLAIQVAAAAVLLVPFVLYHSYLFSLAAYLIYLGLQFWLGRRYSKESPALVYLALLPVFIIGFANAVFDLLLQDTLFQYLSHWRWTELGRHLAWDAIAIAGATVDYFGIVYLLVGKKIPLLKQYADRKLNRYFTAILLCNAVVICGVAWLSGYVARLQMLSPGGLLLFCLGEYLFVTAVNIASIFTLIELAKRGETSQKLAEKELEADLAREYAAVVERNAERLRRYQHDTQHMLASIRAAAADKRTQAAVDDLSLLMGIPAVASYTSHVLLNEHLLLFAENARAARIRVDIQVNLPPELPFTDIELLRLLTNLTDNALKAAATAPPEGKFIEIRAHTAAGFLYISTRNGYTPGAVPAGNGDGAFYLSKLAKKYDGDYTSHGENTVWFVQVALAMGC
jgi:signal transduction histidine kinase